MKSRKKYLFFVLFFILTSGFFNLSSPQTPPQSAATKGKDTVTTIFPVAKTTPTYQEIKNTYPIDLSTPQNIKSNFEYNPATDRYELRTKIGNEYIATPITLTREEYYNYSFRKSMELYFRDRYLMEFDSITQKKDKDALSAFDFKVNIGPADKIFGPGGVRLTANGNLTTKLGFTHTSTQNPTLTERQRNRTAFDFDSQIQAVVKASVGDKLNFDMNYNTESVFNFDTKKLNVGYNGKEDEIVKVLEAGNVSMNTTNSLIRGGSALFGVHTRMQFGKLSVDAVFSQQESQSRSISSKGNVQTTPFEVAVDNYDENMHYFLGHYLHDHYDDAMKTLPYISSPIKIDRIEVWVTNRRANFNEARNIVAFTDLAEHDAISNTNIHQAGENLPYNDANDLYTNLINNYPGARNISTVNQTLGGFLENGWDYEKIENARKLTEGSEYTFSPQLGYISLRYSLQADEVLAVAYSYMYQGIAYQVGEFSTDNPNGSKDNLYVKLIKGTTVSPASPTWKLMMKNIYAITANSETLTQEKFRLNIKYLNDTTGVYLNYITEGKIANQLLLRVERLDRLDSRNEPHPDGFFDYVPGFTVIPGEGKIIFPVVEPFGSHLRKMIGDDRIADKYVFQELYDSTLTVARQTAEKNKFILAGEYKGSNGYNGNSFGMNIAKGSVIVTANGVRLKENVDYTVDYTTGQVIIINPMYENADIQKSFEDRSSFGMQRKTMMGTNLNYAVNKQFNIGGTIMRLSEMPLTMKTEPGQESIANTLFGFNVNYAAQSQSLTNLLDKIPLLELTAPSQITFTAEYAHLIPGHYKSKYGGNYSYIDDFEQAKQIIDLRSPYAWNLSSTPSTFEESKKVNNTDYGKNRSLLAWYHIDALFTRKSSLTPTHIKNDLDQLSNHYVREILESELFPDKDATFGESATIPVLNLAYYPSERGPYNLDVAGMNPYGALREPEKRWGGITRRIESGNTDFEANNIGTLDFWLLDPFIGRENARGGDLYFNLGEVSEDILKDEKKFFENGLPVDTVNFNDKVERTVWGLVPKQQSLVYAFDNAAGAREKQDVGFDGLPTRSNDENALTEYTHPTYANYLAELDQVLSPETKETMLNDPFSPLNDPAGDNYHYFRGADYDNRQLSILDRYKHYNGVEGNSAEASGGGYNTASRLVPDVEDINQDNTLNETEKYFQYNIAIRPDSMVVGKNHIVQKMEVKVLLKNGKSETATWYQFKIPLSEYEKKVGNINDFRTIRFVRMFLTNFSDSVILRFGTLQLSYGQWRTYTKDLFDPKLPPTGTGNISMSTVNIEENGSKEPVNYIMPPGVNRILDPGQTQLRQQNEQSMSLLVSGLSQGDARAIYKSTSLDTRQYRRLQMFTHAEKTLDMPTNLQDNDLSVFLRLGSDYKNNYYEYEVPLKITPPGHYSDARDESRKIVWPESNMIDFNFDLLTSLKLQRNKEKQKGSSDVTYYTPFSIFDPEKPMNKVSVVGNPTISDIRVIMIGVRNNSRATQSAEVWVDELRLTDFNEDGGWAGNANLYVGLSDMGSVSFSGRKETAGFGSLDQGIMDRNIDDMYQYNVSSQIDLSRFFPEKAKIRLPFYYSYTENVISPKYNPLDQDVLLKDALDAMETQAEKDSINSIAQNKKITKSIAFNNVRVEIQSKKPMPYDPANFTFDYSHVEDYLQDATTQREQTIVNMANLKYAYSPMFKPWKPFARTDKKPKEEQQQRNTPSRPGSGFLQNIEIGYLPKVEINLERTRNYYEVQLRDLGDLGGNTLPPSVRDDFFWNRSLNAQWNLTKNLNLTLYSGTNARIRTLEDITSDNLTPNDEYFKKKKSIWQDIKDMGDPMDYKQTFSAVYALPFNMIPALNFIKSGSLSYNSGYQWQRGATLDYGDNSQATDNIQMGNIISNTRTVGINNVQFDLLPLYNKSKFLSDVNKRFTSNRGATSIRTATTTRNTSGVNAAAEARKAELEKRKKKYEGSVTLNSDSTTVLAHQLNNKRLRITARDERGKLYNLKYKAIDNNSIQIQNKDSVNLKLVISQLPPLDEESWYRSLQVIARGLMMVRSFDFSYSEGNDMMIPNFKYTIGDFFGQSSVGGMSAPGLDFAFGLAGEDYIEKINAPDKQWLVKNANDSRTAMFNKTKTFNFRANLEPVTGMRVTLNATRTKTDRHQIYMSAIDGSMPRQFTGNFSMTTISLGTAFASNNAKNGYQSDAFDAFLKNRDIIAKRLNTIYAQTTYPDAGFLKGNPVAGQPFNPNNGGVELNSTDVLIPAFIAAYTGQKAKSVGLSAFPALKKLLPNWNITYDGLLQAPFIRKYFKSFTIEHAYSSIYSVGAFNSFSSWVGVGNDDGIGFIKNVMNNSPYPSSPYDITAVSIVETFNPLLGIKSTLMNNMSLTLSYTSNRNINLNVSAYQIVEQKRNALTFGTGYRFENFNKILKIRKTGGPNFNNEMKFSVDVSHNMDQILIRKIEENLTQATSGNSNTMIRFFADYSLSKLVNLQAFFDRQISKPLVSATAYPVSKSSFGVNVKVSLVR